MNLIAVICKFKTSRDIFHNKKTEADWNIKTSSFIIEHFFVINASQRIFDLLGMLIKNLVFAIWILNLIIFMIISFTADLQTDKLPANIARYDEIKWASFCWGWW